MSNSVHEMGLAHPGFPVYKQGIVCLGRGFRDGHRGGVRHLITGADDEIIESIRRVQPYVIMALLSL